MSSEFDIIPSCSRDEKHYEFLKNTESITLLDDHLTFNLGDSFDSFESLRARLEAHSEHSNVHYWMRDTRTVEGARMKTTRKIEGRLKYYNVKFACVHGGGFTKKGKGLRNTTTVKLNCPAHVTLRANRTGERLEVVSVCNHHNHDISPDISRHMRQARKLTGQLREEVQDFLRMGMSKRRVLDFIEWRSGKKLTYKDVVNMAAALKGTGRPTEQRKQYLMDIMKKLGQEFGSQSGDSNYDSSDFEVRKQRRKTPVNKHKTRTEEIKFNDLMEEQWSDMVPDPIDEVIVNNSVDTTSDDNSENGLQDIENADHMENDNIMEYLLPDDYAEPVLADTEDVNRVVEVQTLNYENLEVEHEGDTEDNCTNFDNDNAEIFVNNEVIPEENENDLGNPVTILKDDMIHFVNTTDNAELDANHVFQVSNKDNENYFQYLNHIVIEDKHLINEEVDFENLNENIDEVQVRPPSEMYMLSNDEVVLEESWAQENILDNIKVGSGVEINIFDKCLNCDKIREDLNEEINALREDKRVLIEETERLKEEKEKLVADINNIKEKEHSNREITDVPVAHKVRPFKIKNKIYFVKI